MKDSTLQAVATALLITLGGLLFVSTWKGDDYKPQHAPEQYAARKHANADECPKSPCVDVPMACYVHGGAPQTFQCPHD